MRHEHAMYDSDTHFIIDGVKRTVKNADAVKMLLVQHDHNSERFTFELPRYIDGHDMMLCDSVQIHYINAGSTGKSEDVYEVDDLSLSPADENVVIFSWLISGSATKHVGSLSFAIRFVCLDAEDKKTVVYAWHTTPFSQVSILENVYNIPAVPEDYSDIIAEWNERFSYLETWLETLKSGNVPKIGWVALLSDSWEGDNNLYKQIVEIDGVTKNSQVDLTPSVEQLAIFYEKDITFVTENDNGVVTVYVIGQKPINDYTIQATITEVDI